MRATERIANALDRAYPLPNIAAKEPTDGISIVTNEMVLEEEVRAELRSKGFMPDDIDAMVQEWERENAESEATIS